MNYVRPSYFPRLVAEETIRLIRKAPAGGTFHDVIVSEPSNTNEGFANQGARFTVATPSGEVEVIVTPLLRERVTFDANAPTPYHYRGPSWADGD